MSNFIKIKTFCYLSMIVLVGVMLASCRDPVRPEVSRTYIIASFGEAGYLLGFYSYAEMRVKVSDNLLTLVCRWNYTVPVGMVGIKKDFKTGGPYDLTASNVDNASTKAIKMSLIPGKAPIFLGTQFTDGTVKTFLSNESMELVCGENTSTSGTDTLWQVQNF